MSKKNERLTNGAACDDSATNTPNQSASTDPQQRPGGGAGHRPDGEKKKNNAEVKSLWVTVFKCFQCGKRGHKLPKCNQCSQAYYCNADCQRKHWKKHKPVCRAAVAALARRATRERLARAVREKGKDKVEHSGDDELCVICQDTTVDAVEVSVWEFYNR